RRRLRRHEGRGPGSGRPCKAHRRQPRRARDCACPRTPAERDPCRTIRLAVGVGPLCATAGRSFAGRRAVTPGETRAPAVWFPTIQAGTGTDVFTQRLCDGLNARGVRAQITWLPHRAEYVHWTVPAPPPPAWANVVHANSW